MCTEKKPHKHAELIKAWADGESIQVRPDCKDLTESDWMDIILPPQWLNNFQYRIKPVKKSRGQLLAEAQDYCWETCNIASRMRFEAIASEFLALFKEQE